MSPFAAMPGRVYFYSAAFHVVVIVLLYGLAHWHLFDRDFEEETPLVVQIVNVAPQTRATQVNPTPPKPDKPEQTAQAEPPKPEPPKPEPPKPEPPKPEPPKPEPPPPPEQKPAPPEPKPEPKPEPPKPPEPKPEPKPEPPKPPPAKPQPPKNSKDDLAFDSLLKNLAKRDPAREPAKDVAAAEPKASSQPIAPLAPQLSTSELDAIIQQLRDCYFIQAGARDAKDLNPNFRVVMNPDATVRTATLLNSERLSDPFFQAAAEAARRALFNPHCSPLKLPLQKYEQWQTFTITFNPKDLQ
jgi:hypothetical protein